MAQTFHIVLKDDKGFDAQGSREFDLVLNSTFPIGRSSRNAAKPELMPASDNAYIDSPVVSRDHAVFSANANSGVPQVYVSDSGSMHGTMVNGVKLVPNTPEPLSTGDLLQFGADVNRNESTYLYSRAKPADTHPLLGYFVARKYTFASRLVLPQHMFSHGFTVPEAESEVEEVNHSPRRGSQQNPLTLDDSDSDSASESDEAQDASAEVTMFEQEADLDDEIPLAAADNLLSHLVPQPSPAVSSLDVEDAYSGEEPQLVYIMDNDDDDNDSNLEEVDDDMFSNLDEVDLATSVSVIRGVDVEAEETVDMVHHTGSTYESSVTMSVPPERSPEASSSALRTRDFFWSGMSSEDMHVQARELPSFGAFIDQTTFADSVAPPLPPRPAAPQAVPWSRMDLTSSVQANDSHERLSEEFPGHNYLGTNFGDRPSLFSPAPLTSQKASQGGFNGCEGALDFQTVPAAGRIQTPPPLPNSDLTTSTTPPPSRRTKVSITEIVEEVDDQPPTPTSMNGVKRKADVLGEEASIPTVLSTTTGVDKDFIGDAVATEGAAEVAAVIARRPKKQPRSIISRTLRTAAAYIVPGAAVSFALLATLPQSVFEL
ncbi:hypothetical protein P153DRAFT_100313 [Dothidotthia symphoricarpi CBS 119687]|uniref:FHA domain-containing protein n=1 Tax=Dothidotthia symphoricarpi CBS 119687 TaxID=1392245 RepID=A0A6A6APL9_9PLEO|nr:uncharacterized protein P153DRAFT_100313 [Dothidotthia symphoricarpi CBS 119687]KAF2133869.1 hypothetical protein P153DRAFT_100313 [Dothidotthia symphoricarpi CBS 119687]